MNTSQSQNVSNNHQIQFQTNLSKTFYEQDSSDDDVDQQNLQPSSNLVDQQVQNKPDVSNSIPAKDANQNEEELKQDSGLQTKHQDYSESKLPIDDNETSQKDDATNMPAVDITKQVSVPKPSGESLEQQKKNQKIAHYQTVIQEHRRRLIQVDKLLKETKQDSLHQSLNDDSELSSITFGNTSGSKRGGGTEQHTVEELEKLREAVVDNMIVQQNELKFLINSNQHLAKDQHADRVCEAYFETEKTWFAALIQDIHENVQEAEVAWIGYNIQERVPKKKVTILECIDPEDLFDGAACNAVFPSDGMWYEASIDHKLTEKEAEQFAASDLRSNLPRYQVKYKSFNTKLTVPLDYIRMTKDQALTNLRLKHSEGAFALPTNNQKANEKPGEFTIPDHLRLKPTDTDKVKLQKRKKVKAVKYVYKMQQQDHCSNEKKSEWMNFQQKGSRQSKGHFATSKTAQSIFKSPETVLGKVGVIGSGQTMTGYKSSKSRLSNYANDDKDSAAQMTSLLGKSDSRPSQSAASGQGQDSYKRPKY